MPNSTSRNSRFDGSDQQSCSTPKLGFVTIFAKAKIRANRLRRAPNFVQPRTLGEIILEIVAFMKNKKVLSIIFFLINLCFWLVITIFYSFIRNNNNLVVSILLFIEPIIFLFALIGYLNKWKIVYYLTLLFLLINSILSITDEVGILDIFSLSLNIIMFVLLALQWRNFRRKK